MRCRMHAPRRAKWKAQGRVQLTSRRANAEEIHANSELTFPRIGHGRCQAHAAARAVSTRTELSNVLSPPSAAALPAARGKASPQICCTSGMIALVHPPAVTLALHPAVHQKTSMPNRCVDLSGRTPTCLSSLSCRRPSSWPRPRRASPHLLRTSSWRRPASS